MTALELFAGAGGASLGLHRAGFAHLACVERNASAAATLRAAGLPALEADVRAVDFTAWRSRVDLLWASPPCQPGSTAGQRLGAVDERDGWPATLAAVDACRPTWFLAENVLGWAHFADLCGGSGGSGSSGPACHLARIADEVARRFAFTGAWWLDASDLEARYWQVRNAVPRVLAEAVAVVRRRPPAGGRLEEIDGFLSRHATGLRALVADALHPRTL